MQSQSLLSSHEAILRSEFATVAVEVDSQANSPRLRITNLDNGATIFLDPLELACLAELQHEDLAQFVEPPPDYDY